MPTPHTRLKNERHERFAREYLKDLCGKQAAIRAGFSPRTAKVQACALLTRPDLTARIGELQRQVEAKIEDAAVMLRKHLYAMATVCITDLYNDDWTLKPFDEMTEGARLLISGFRFKDGELTEVKVLDKLRAMELLGKHHAVSAWKENISIVDVDTRVERIRRAQERMGKRAGVRREPIDVTPIQKEIQS